MSPNKPLAIGLLALALSIVGYSLAATMVSTQNGARVHVNTTSNLSLLDNAGNSMATLDFGSVSAGGTTTVSGKLVYNSNAPSPNGILQVSTQNLPAGFTFTSSQNGAPLAPGTTSVSFSLTIGPGAAAGDYAWDVFLSVSGIPPSSGFSFGAAGDFGVQATFNQTLSKLGGSGVNFFIALGDLSYSGQEKIWCEAFKSKFPNVEIITGNHDAGGSGGDISKYATYCPFTLTGLVGGSDPVHTYGYEYYFDYPAQRPLARFIQIAPAISFSLPGYTATWNYSIGNSHYNFVRDSIESARSAGITWVIVSMHEDYISAGGHGNEIGSDLFNLLVREKADLVLQGHSHNYQRSKQVAQSPSCATVDIAYNPACVVNDGSTGLYDRGKGSVWQIVGTGGKSHVAISTNVNWFAKTDDTTFGFMKFMVGPDAIRGEFVASVGTFTDSFDITGPINAVSASLDKKTTVHVQTALGPINLASLRQPGSIVEQETEMPNAGDRATVVTIGSRGSPDEFGMVDNEFSCLIHPRPLLDLDSR